MGRETINKEVLEELARLAEPYPYIDPDLNIYIIEETLTDEDPLVPFMVITREFFRELERKIIGA